jgi:hypothetical protein
VGAAFGRAAPVSGAATVESEVEGGAVVALEVIDTLESAAFQQAAGFEPFADLQDFGGGVGEDGIEPWHFFGEGNEGFSGKQREMSFPVMGADCMKSFHGEKNIPECSQLNDENSMNLFHMI